MIKMHCDRCGKEIKGTTYYTINICAEDINPAPVKTVTYTTAIQNLQTSTLTMLNVQKQYCKLCKDDIERFINNYYVKEI